MSDALQQLFAGRELLVATMHEKERVLGPAFLARFPLAGCRAITGLDTDRFGAFSGERRRELDPRATAEAKARAGAELAGAELVLASEGSFGPHPASPFLSCDEEWLVLWDRARETTYAHRHLSVEAICGGVECSTWEEVARCAERFSFPEHALVLKHRSAWEPGDPIAKDLLERAALEDAARAMLRAHGRLWVEVDLRAHRNATRRRVIERAAREFANELAQLCPRCGAVHYAVARALRGLPCADCGEPTLGIRALVRACARCGASSEEPRPDGRAHEDPGACASCNP
ncbi:MAG: hypothetical protein IPN34_23095 [Planctomycetes bacterium]|nr:hypothetical protein [Planctomycetota bacterium]